MLKRKLFVRCDFAKRITLIYMWLVCNLANKYEIVQYKFVVVQFLWGNWAPPCDCKDAKTQRNFGRRRRCHRHRLRYYLIARAVQLCACYVLNKTRKKSIQSHTFTEREWVDSSSWVRALVFTCLPTSSLFFSFCCCGHWTASSQKINSDTQNNSQFVTTWG